jgi:uncharacterized membrane protein
MNAPLNTSVKIEDPLIRSITPLHPLQWLALAWYDMARCGWISFAHGLVLALLGGVLLLVAHDRFWLLAGAFSGFLVIAPVLATSLYALSRALERGEKANFALVRKVWVSWQKSHANKWGNDYWALVIVAKDGYVFELWLALGGLLAAPMFASSVVSIPLLLDRRVTLKQAVLTSWRTVLANPGPMAFWAFLIMGFTLLGLASLLLGLIPIMPMLGHASWHAYRDLVDVSDLPERTSSSTSKAQNEAKY